MYQVDIPQSSWQCRSTDNDVYNLSVCSGRARSPRAAPRSGCSPPPPFPPPPSPLSPVSPPRTPGWLLLRIAELWSSILQGWWCLPLAMALFTVREMDLLAAYHKNGLALFIFSLLNKKEEPTTQNTGAMRATFTHA